MGVALFALLASAACGKKGPPLAPLVPIPAPIQLIEAQRFGGDVYVTVTIPSANIDEYTPADIGRVEIYGYTGRTAPPRAQWVAVATLIATVPVAPVPKPGEKPDAAANLKPSNEPAQGARVTVLDTLTADELVQGKEPPVVRGQQPAVRDSAPEPIAGTGARTPDRGSRIAEEPLKRFYTAVPFNTRGRNGPPGGVAEFPMLPVPDSPPSIGIQYNDRAIMLAWEPSGGLLGFLLSRSLPEELVPFDVEDAGGAMEADDVAGPLLYTVYREILPDVTTPPAPAATWREESPAPINPIPIAALEFTDSIEFERRRCYTVRAVRGVGPEARVGNASPVACLTPVDVFAPARPRSLAAVASEGVMSLIWEPNGELDLGGYIVLRAEAPGDTLLPLTAAPVVEAAYRDETVKPGVRYVYAVIAVDNRLPLPNMSAESNRVEETAR